MSDLAKRFSQNPLLRPGDLTCSSKGLYIACRLNPGVFRFNNKTWLLVRVAERPLQSAVTMSFPVKNNKGGTEIIEIPLNDADLIATHARVVSWKGKDYLNTLSHLRLLSSDDGIHFSKSPDYPALHSTGILETFGIDIQYSVRGDQRIHISWKD